MNKISYLATAALAGLIVFSSSSPAKAGVTAYVQMSPATLKFDITGVSGYNCFTNDNNGFLKLLFSQSCTHVVNTWSHQLLALPYSPNPSSGIDANYFATTPPNTAINVRMEAYESDGTLSQLSAYNAGTGLQGLSVANRGDGLLLLNVAMMQTANGLGTVSPTVSWVAGNVYSL